MIPIPLWLKNAGGNASKCVISTFSRREWEKLDKGAGEQLGKGARNDNTSAFSNNRGNLWGLQTKAISSQPRTHFNIDTLFTFKIYKDKKLTWKEKVNPICSK